MESIGDYAVIGDCRAAALVSRAGAIEWLCWPRFDSPSLFAGILDDGAGAWRLAPAGPFRATRSYADCTNVLVTRFECPSGVVTLTDFMPVASEEEKRRHLLPDHAIARIARCERGAVEIASHLAPRPDYARAPPRMRDAGRLGWRIELGHALALFRADWPHAAVETPTGGTLVARGILRAGEEAHFALTFTDDGPAIVPPLGDWTRESLDRSLAWWRAWSARMRYQGPARESVIRSALVLKLLVYAPSGAVVAAPTTSLPERPCGDLNWDYRYCWLRDASLTVRALFGLGYPEEAEAFLSWLLRSTRLTQPSLRILYDLYGNHPGPERTLPRMRGHFGARPVRIGNAAADQVQLDVYGEVIDATAQFVRRGGRLDRETQRMLRDLGRYVCANWQAPDNGIWEPRSGRARHTHSLVLCWTALDRLCELHDKSHLKVPVEEFARERDRIRRAVETRGWNEALQSYVGTLDGQSLDASVLLIPWYGFEPATSERMRRTFARVRDELGAGRGLLRRYRGGDSPGEGAFGICGFWGAEHLALGGGTVEEAAETFFSLCGMANDVGLFAEEIDPATGEALGNFPQAFTHVGLINAALSLCRRMRGERALSRALPHRRETAEANP